MSPIFHRSSMPWRPCSPPWRNFSGRFCDRREGGSGYYHPAAATLPDGRQGLLALIRRLTLDRGAHDDAALKWHRLAVERESLSVSVWPSCADFAPASGFPGAGDEIEPVRGLCSGCLRAGGHDLLLRFSTARPSRGFMGSKSHRV